MPRHFHRISGVADAIPDVFPSVLKTSGRSIVDAHGHTVASQSSMWKGFNIDWNGSTAATQHWSLADFQAMKSIGASYVRFYLYWNLLEPTQGFAIGTGAGTSYYVVQNLDAHVANCNAAGLYCLLELDINPNSGHLPGWVTPTDISGYSSLGQNVTSFLASRYGNPSSPQYNKAVCGFGLNEPKPPGGITSTMSSDMESAYRTMIQWCRNSSSGSPAGGGASNWMALVTYGFSNYTPLFNDANAGWTGSQNAWTNASPSAWSPVGGNVILDGPHDEKIGTLHTVNTPANSLLDGRVANGSYSADTSTNGYSAQVNSSGDTYTTYPVADQYPAGRSVAQAQHAAFIAPYGDYAAQANIPWMIGEWGWNQSRYASSGEPSNGSYFINDKFANWKAKGAAAASMWYYNTAALTSDPWAARPGGTWQTIVTTWMGLT